MLRVTPEQMVVGRRYVYREDEPMVLAWIDGNEARFRGDGDRQDDALSQAARDEIDAQPWRLDEGDWYEVPDSYEEPNREPYQRGPVIRCDSGNDWDGDET